jgi:hypothetical protein
VLACCRQVILIRAPSRGVVSCPQLPSLSNLRYLNVSHTQLDDDSLAVLLIAIVAHPRLSSLRCGGHALGPKFVDAAAVCFVRKNMALTALDLSQSTMTVDPATLTSLWSSGLAANKSLTALNLSRVALGDAQWTAIAQVCVYVRGIVRGFLRGSAHCFAAPNAYLV